MEVDVEAGGEVLFKAEMDVDMDVDSDESTDMEMDIDSDFEADSTFASSVGSAQSSFTAMTFPSSSTNSLSALGAIELDIEMEDVFEMAEEAPLDNLPTDSALVPTEHHTYTESTTPPGSPAATSPTMSHPATTNTDLAPAPAHAPAQPSQSAVQVAPVDYYARAADPDFIEAQSQAVSKALPESDDTDLDEGPRDYLEVAASVPLPGSDEEDIHLAHSTPSEIIAEGASDHTLATRSQVAPQWEFIPEASIPLLPTVPEECVIPTTHGDMELVGEDDDDTPSTRSQVDSHMGVVPEEDDNHATRSQVVPHGDDTPEASGAPPTTNPVELAEPADSPDAEMAEQLGDVGEDEDGDEDDGQEWETVYDVNVVAAPQAPVSDHVAAVPVPGPVPITSAPNPLKHRRDASTEFAHDAEDLPAAKLRIYGDDDDNEEDDAEDDDEGPLGYDIESAKAIMEDFLCERLPVVAAEVMFPATNFSESDRDIETELLAAWLYGKSLPEEGSHFIEVVFEEHAEMSGEDLGDLIWNWYEERIAPELENYDVPMNEDNIELLEELLEEALSNCFDGQSDDDDDNNDHA